MLDDERVLRELTGTRFTDVRVLADTDSTNRVVAELAAAGAPEGLVVVAEHQSAGRGRLGRTWEAPPGSGLLVSILLRPALPPEDLHLVTAAVGLAGRDACRRVAGVEAELKWPNDLLVGDLKLAGILAEAAAGAVVVGMGTNVTANPEGAISLAAANPGWRPDRTALLVTLLRRLDELIRDWTTVRTEYGAGCATVGRRVRVDLGGATVVGTAVAVEGHGHLVVDTDDGPRIAVSAGDVVHLRPA